MPLIGPNPSAPCRRCDRPIIVTLHDDESLRSVQHDCAKPVPGPVDPPRVFPAGEYQPHPSAEVVAKFGATPTGTPAGETETLADAIRAHIRERTDPDCNGDNPQWDGGFKAACSQILAVVDGFAPALPVDGGAGEPLTTENDWREEDERRLVCAIVSLEFAAHELDSTTPNVARPRALIGEALDECRRQLRSRPPARVRDELRTTLSPSQP